MVQTVQDILKKHDTATRTPVPLTVDGALLDTGQNVLLNVEKVPRRDAGPAVILVQLTLVHTVLEMLKNRKTATKTVGYQRPRT